MNTCEYCGKELPEFMIRPDGLPSWLGFLTDDGRIVNVCTECLIKIGEKKLEDEN